MPKRNRRKPTAFPPDRLLACLSSGVYKHNVPRLLPAADMLRNQPSITHPGEWKVFLCNHYYSSQSTQIETSKIHRIKYVKDGKDAPGSRIPSSVVRTAEIMIILDPDSALHLPHSRGSTARWHIIFLDGGCLFCHILSLMGLQAVRTQILPFLFRYFF